MSASEPASRPALTFERLEVGQVYSDRTVTVSAEVVRGYCTALGTHHPVYRGREGDSGGSGALAPPTLAAMWTPPRVCFEGWTIPQGGVHTAQDWQSLLPVHVGETLRQRVTVSEVFRREERRYVVFDATFENNAGAVVARGRMTVLWPA